LKIKNWLIEEPNIEEEENLEIEQQELIIEHLPPIVEASRGGFGSGGSNAIKNLVAAKPGVFAATEEETDDSCLPPPMNDIKAEQSEQVICSRKFHVQFSNCLSY
jgi:hypothetical protein